MRILFVFLLTLLIVPAVGQEWERYDNARFGYGVDVPADFIGRGESDSGDGQAFTIDGRPIDLLVWGDFLLEGFEDEVALRMGWDEDEAWNLTYQATTPRWASYSGIKGSRIFYQRMVLLCDGASYAAFRAEYSVTDASRMDPVIEHMVGSLRGTGC